MNRIAIILLVTIGCVGHAQFAPSTDAALPSAPQARADRPGDSLKSIPIGSLRSQQSFIPQLTSGSDPNAISGSAWAGAGSTGAASDSASQKQYFEIRDSGFEPAQVDLDEDSGESDSTGYKASSYVPLDSWIYPAFERLAGLGYLPTSSLSMRPWTRLESARLLAEAHENIDATDETSFLVLSSLDAEFAQETKVYRGARNAAAQVESTYGRYTELSGTPLRDSYNFAQSISDDFGRPFGKGANGISGLSLRAEGGRFSVYMRGEYQYASAISAYNAAAQQAIATDDGLPFGWNLRTGTTSRIRPIEAYAAINLANWQFSFGQQALWWSPDRFTSLILSNNAEAMPMLRLARAKPIHMPGILSWMGPVHFDAFFSREGGIHYVRLGPTFIPYGNASQPLNPPPYLWGVAFSIKPTRNFELGFAHTTIFAGYGRPLNLATFLHTFSTNGNDQAVDPGKRTTEFNVTYHPPGLRRILIYEELYAFDNPIAGRFLAFYAMDPGVYIPRIPRLEKLDLRMEGVYTDLPGEHDPAYYYTNTHYPQGYTNYGQILGSWIGRQGDGGQATSSYWFSARNKATISYRKMSVDKSFLKGGNLDDISASLTWMPKQGIEVSATGQYEQWKFPLLAPEGKSDFGTILEIRAYPKLRIGMH
jgi:hypothetical protein